MLVKNVKGIDVVSPPCRQLGRLKAMVAISTNWRGSSRRKLVHIQLDDFELYKGKTLYTRAVPTSPSLFTNMKNHSKVLWDKHLGEVLYPVNSGIPSQDKPVQQFEAQVCGHRG